MDRTETASLDIAEFEILFRKNFVFLCLVAMNYVDDKYIAEDIVQEFFIGFWERKATIQLKSNFKAYATIAVRNRSIDYIRKQKVENKRSETIQKEVVYQEMGDADLEDLKYTKYLRIMELVNQLPESRRNILMMHAIEKLSYAEIARRQGVSINTVRTQLTRAYKSLRSHTVLLVVFLFLNIICFIYRCLCKV